MQREFSLIAEGLSLRTADAFPVVGETFRAGSPSIRLPKGLGERRF